MTIDPYWFPGTVLSPGDYELHNFYIYHLPKTGATTVYSSLGSSYRVHFQILQRGVAQYRPPSIDRLDAPKMLEVEHFPMPFALVASHHPFGFHKRFTQDFKLITVLRDPYRRVLSSYTYECMRAGILPSPRGFEDMFRSEENCNMMTKQLSGLAREDFANSDDVQKAINHLTQHFYIYGTTHHISKITSTILKLNKMPNVLCEHLNKTEDRYMLDGSKFEQDVRDLNLLDQKLFDFVEANPRVNIDLGKGSDALPPHQLTVLIKQTQNDTEGAISAEKIIETSRILDKVNDGRCPQDVFNHIFSEIP